MCLGVPGRGDLDEEDWLGARTVMEEEETEEGSSSDEGDEYEEDDELIDEIDRDTFSLEEDDKGEAELDEDGHPVMYLPRTNPRDFYFIYNPDNYYRLR